MSDCQHQWEETAGQDVLCPGGCGVQVRMITIHCLACEAVEFTLDARDATLHMACLPNVR
jgi:hypothetical protein